MPAKPTSPPTQRPPSGFADLLSLVTSPSRLSPAQIKRSRSPSPSAASKPVGIAGKAKDRDQEFSYEIVGVPYAQPAPGKVKSKDKVDKARARGDVVYRAGARGARSRGRGGRMVSGEGRGELQKRKIDKRMIGYPTDFRWVNVLRSFPSAGVSC
jgi:hypothetical protein